IAAAWLFLHPKEYGIRWPRVSTRQANIRLAQSASIYELTICLGNYGSRDGYMRALRNLNPRWEADTTIPAGSTINATARIAWLYRFNCTGGKRAELAKQLVASNVQSALVRVGDVSSVAPATTAGTPPQDEAPPPQPAKPAKPKTYKVQRGENLTSIARKFDCDLGDFAKANKLKAPKYAIRPGQSLKLDGCRG
ncbi:MAG TPA: LysM peptidoglycan-binding domain-containing protein, partial [Thermomonas sp.]|nr:LysM peptidoglycan-binding domain-containing protein [Thermomonas sp.]